MMDVGASLTASMLAPILKGQKQLINQEKKREWPKRKENNKTNIVGLGLV